MTLAATTADSPAQASASWGGVLSMALCVAMLIASEFMPVSLLTPMAEGLRATEGQTGQAISISGLFAVAASMLVTTLAGRLNRKWVLVALTALMLLSLVLVAAAPSFAVLMTGRAVLGICIGGFWALATAVIMRLVPAADVPRALALMYGGQAIAAAFAAPIGSYLAGLFGWREVFWALTPIVAANLVWHVAALPSLPAAKRQDFGVMLRLLKRRSFLLGLIASMLSWGSAFTMFTYLRPFLERVTGADVTTLSGLLLVLGCAGFVGTWASGRFVKGNAAPILKLPALLMGGCTVGLLLLGGSPLAAGLLLTLWGAMNTAMSVIWMTWMSQNADEAPEAGGSLMVAAIQASILLGALVGGWLLDGLSIQATFIGSVVLAAAAVLLIGNGRKLLSSPEPPRPSPEPETIMSETLPDTSTSAASDMDRRRLVTLAGAGAVALAAPTFPTSAKAQTMPNAWDKTFPKSDKVDHRKVTFTNRFGITLAGDLYAPKGASGRLAALAVSGPFGAVKEQSSGLYAQTMAERGFVALAFDPSFTGESSGQPRNIASPDINTEDFSAAVDFLGLLPNVDRERIGMLGICGWGGMALGAAAIDKRVKAVAVSTMYDMTRVISKGYDDSLTAEQRTANLEQLGRQRWKDAEKGRPAYGPVMNELKGGEAKFLVDYHDYYRTPRGFHPRAVNSNASWAITSSLSFMKAPLLDNIAEIAPRPLLMVHGAEAHSRYFSETAYAAAAEPKELLIIPRASHTDLYDRVDVIPFDKLTDFFRRGLSA